MMIQYLRKNLITGLKTAPWHKLILNIGLFIIFAIIASAIGLTTGLLNYEVIDSTLVYILPFALFLFPSMFEEIIFRGLLIPNDTCFKGAKEIAFYSLMSSILFVLWHPLNALTINPKAQVFFLDPWFLLIAFVLGMVCSLGYIFSRSLWVSIVMHWLTVMAWVFLLGGRNLILE
ncbi:MAG: CPBP family intramembrane metalloprotease [Sulfuriflexus sp.]|nr:CPBP family intramembrane metalloprotease [Sulfuriflexus sp.]